MTDQELLKLLDEKMPEELTLDEIELLRTRLAESPALREALASQVHFESYLQSAFARLKSTPASIAAKARNQQSPRSGLGLVLILLLIVVPAVAIMGVVALNVFSGSEVAQQEKPENEKEQGRGRAKDDTAAEQSPEKKNEPATKQETTEPINPPTKSSAETEATPAKTKTVTKQPAAPVPLPWQAAVDSKAEPPAFQQLAYQTFDLTKEVVRRDALQVWFEAAAGHNYRLHEVDTQFGRCGALEGLARLKSPWLNDSLLRMSLENYNKLQIHLFHANVGVTLTYHQDNQYCWAAYTTTRKPKTAKPETWAITSTDDSRNYRTEIRYGGPIDLRFHDGQVILSRGDIVLASAPLPGPPDDVYFEGRATFYGLQFLRAKDAPTPEPQRKLVYETDRPADLEWTRSTPEIKQPQKNDDGSITFSADNVERFVWYWTPLPQRGIQQVVFQLKNITPGAAVYLGHDKGRPNECIRFFTNRRTKRLIARMRGIDNDHEIDFSPAGEAVEPCANPEDCWVRLQFGPGTFRYWMSADGVNWAQPEYLREALPGNIDSLGVFLAGKRPKTQVTLARLELRELSALTNLAKADLRDKAIAPVTAANFDAWKEDVAKTKPEDVDADDWRRACAVKTLGAGTTKEIGHPLLEMLLDDPATQKLPIADQLQVHVDAFALVSDLKDGQSMRIGLERRLANLGLKAFQEQNLPPWSTIRRTFIGTRIHTVNRNYGPPLALLEPLIRTEIMQRAYAQQPQELLALCEQLRFYHVEENVPMIVWAEAHARRESASRSAAASGPAVMKESWRPLLVEEVSKETYNLTSELQAVLDSEAWEDAARLITSVDPEAAPGVSPYVKDRQLLTSLPVAVQLLLHDYPQLKEALGQRYGPLAKLRIGQAVAAADAAAIELATVQFGATAESAEALRWLGDRALSNGWFEESLTHYQRAIDRHPLLAGEIAPRIRLAAAMLGRDAGSPATGVVQFNNLKLDAAQFEALVAEMRARGTSAAVSPALHVMPGSALPVPQPTAYATHNRSRLDGPVGDRPQEEVGRKTNQFQVPWPDKQISTAIEGDTLFVTNRFQVAAYNLTNGQRTWQQNKFPPGAMQKSQDFALIAMRPLVLRDQILTRQLYGRSPQIVCLDKANGNLLWASERGDREFFVSDPVYLHGQIVALSVAMQEQQEGQLRWNVLDPATGELQVTRDLVRLRNTWGSRACCEVLPLDHQLVVALGGITLGLDARGQVSWVRKQVTMPSDEDQRWVLQTFQRPIVVGNQLVIVQPGTRSAVCLDPTTGLQKWETLVPDLLGCWGVSQGLVILQTEAGLQALDVGTGKLRWLTPLTDLQPQALVDEQAILVARKVPKPDDKKPAIQLVWLDPATGSERAATLLPALTDGTPRLGPLVPYKDRLFTFFGRGQHDPNRDVVELVPSGPIQP